MKSGSPGRASVSACDAAQPSRRPRGDSAQRRPRLDTASAPLVGKRCRLLGLAGLLLLTMPEQGYRPVAGATPRVAGVMQDVACWPRHRAWRAALRSIFVITVLYGMSSEALSRLAPLHLLATIGLPAALLKRPGLASAGGSVAWQCCGHLGHQPDDGIHNPQRIVQILLAFTVVMLLATLLFALAGVFWLGLIAVWMTRGCGLPHDPGGRAGQSWACPQVPVRRCSPCSAKPRLSGRSVAPAAGPRRHAAHRAHRIRCRHGAAPSATALWPALRQQTGAWPAHEAFIPRQL